ncbi:major facilitator superfamily transporter [Arcobacter venerupis]|uniref:Major facilitator superfamily transporter n=1 Tax=Arcobacter venerupis TaxID=1054033 RepID=A0AAE7BA08_9BACT|nr:MFS transporter [Arcobacter venerupis]QKF68099.1 major facilitator superfamily transporter [Arcobacter venerupis]RWS48853.1 MFS transporter [Arcobacter venerupis]
MTKKLLPLALGGLAIGTTEFAIMGLLPDVANDLNISIPVAGHLISIYALGVVIGAPILVALSSKFPAKNILIVFMILFTFFNFLSAIAPNYTTLLISRFLSGLPHGAFFGVGTVVAAKLADKGKSAQAIAVMFTGLTIANVAMVPLTTYLGHTFSWRYAFAIVSIIGLITIFSLYKNLPKQKEVKTVTLKEELEFFKTIKAWHILAIVATGFGGLFAWISYIAPLLIHVTKFEESSVSYLMIVAGLGMLVGNIVGGYLADKRNPIKVAIFLLSMMVICLILVFSLSEYKFATVVLTFVCGAFAMSIGAPINIIMLDSAKHSAMLGAAFLQAAFNVANSLGAFLGGIPLFMGLNYNYPSLSGALMALVGVGLCLIFLKKYKVQG